MAKKNTPLPNPLPQAGEGMVMVAYHDGPEAIGFMGRHWRRDEAQAVTELEWAAMQARADFNEFNFIEEQ